MKKISGIILVLIVVTLMSGCGTKSEDKDMGVGPVKNIVLKDTIDESLVSEGKALFDSKCVICHSFDQKLVGPALDNVTTRRSAEWIMNMMLNPEGMVKENATAKALLAEYNNVPMINQSLSEKEARAILEYFRQLDSK